MTRRSAARHLRHHPLCNQTPLCSLGFRGVQHLRVQAPGYDPVLIQLTLRVVIGALGAEKLHIGLTCGIGCSIPTKHQDLTPSKKGPHGFQIRARKTRKEDALQRNRERIVSFSQPTALVYQRHNKH